VCGCDHVEAVPEHALGGRVVSCQHLDLPIAIECAAADSHRPSSSSACRVSSTSARPSTNSPRAARRRPSAPRADAWTKAEDDASTIAPSSAIAESIGTVPQGSVMQIQLMMRCSICRAFAFLAWASATDSGASASGR